MGPAAMMRISAVTLLLAGAPVVAQTTPDPFPPLVATAESSTRVGYREFAEGSFRFGRGGVDTLAARSDSAMTYPIAEYDHRPDPAEPRSGYGRHRIPQRQRRPAPWPYRVRRHPER